MRIPTRYASTGHKCLLINNGCMEKSVLDLRKGQERLNIRAKYVIVGDKNIL
jgi:hypothetical protein